MIKFQYDWAKTKKPNNSRSDNDLEQDSRVIIKEVKNHKIIQWLERSIEKVQIKINSNKIIVYFIQRSLCKKTNKITLPSSLKSIESTNPIEKLYS